MAEPADPPVPPPVLTPELLRHRTSYDPAGCAPRRVAVKKALAEWARIWGIGRPEGRGWCYMVPGQAHAAPELAALMAAGWDLLQRFGQPGPDLVAPVDAWTALYALYTDAGLVRLQLQVDGLLPTLEAHLRSAGLQFEQQSAQVLTGGHDLFRRSDDLRRAIAFAPPEERAAARDLAARWRAGAGPRLRITLGWYFPEVWGDDAGEAWLADPDWEMEILYACVQDADLVYRILRARRGWRSYADLVARFPDRALGWMLEAMGSATSNFDHIHIAHALAAWRHPEVARVFAARLSRQEYRGPGVGWLLSHPDLARPALEAAVAAKGRNRPLAAEVLGRLGHAAPEEARPAADVPPEAWPEILRAPPWTKPGKNGKPPKPPKLSPAWKADTFTRLRLRDGRPLPVAAMDAFAGWLSTTDPGGRDPAGLDGLRRALDPASLTALARDLLQAYRMNARQRNGWFIHALRWFADEALIEEIASGDLDRYDPILTLLSFHGSPAAARALVRQRHALEGPDQIGDHAWDLLERCAQAQGLRSVEELIEAVFPLADADPDGTEVLVYGGRRLRAGFDAYLLPRLLDEDGTPRDHLPPRRPDQDPAAAEAIRLRWEARKAEVAALAPLLLRVLEEDMLLERSRSAGRFRRRWLQHPVLCGLAQRIVWCALTPDGPRAFRLTEDGSLADSADAPFDLPPEAEIRVAHPALLPADEVARWAQILSDYAILQPFPQILRPHARLPAPRTDRLPIRPVPRDALRERLIGGGWRACYDYGAGGGGVAAILADRIIFARSGLRGPLWDEMTLQIRLIGDPVCEIAPALCVDYVDDVPLPQMVPDIVDPIMISEVLADFPLLTPEP